MRVHDLVERLGNGCRSLVPKRNFIQNSPVLFVSDADDEFERTVCNELGNRKTVEAPEFRDAAAAPYDDAQIELIESDMA